MATTYKTHAKKGLVRFIAGNGPLPKTTGIGDPECNGGRGWEQNVTLDPDAVDCVRCSEKIAQARATAESRKAEAIAKETGLSTYAARVAEPEDPTETFAVGTLETGSTGMRFDDIEAARVAARRFLNYSGGQDVVIWTCYGDRFIDVVETVPQPTTTNERLANIYASILCVSRADLATLSPAAYSDLFNNARLSCGGQAITTNGTHVFFAAATIQGAKEFRTYCDAHGVTYTRPEAVPVDAVAFDGPNLVDAMDPEPAAWPVRSHVATQGGGPDDRTTSPGSSGSERSIRGRNHSGRSVCGVAIDRGSYATNRLDVDAVLKTAAAMRAGDVRGPGKDVDPNGGICPQCVAALMPRTLEVAKRYFPEADARDLVDHLADDLPKRAA